MEILVERNESTTIKKFGFYYQKFVGANNHAIVSWDSVISKTTSSSLLGYGMLLPLLEEQGEREGEGDLQSNLFVLISSSWKPLDTNNKVSDIID